MPQQKKTTRKVNSSNMSARGNFFSHPKSKVQKNASRTTAQKQHSQSFRNTINTQTPSQRQAQRSGKKITGSVKNMEVKSHTRSDKRQYATAKKKRKVSLGEIGIRLIVFLIFFGIIFGLVSLISLSKIKDTSTNAPTYKVTIGSEETEDEYTYTSNGEISGANGSLYVCIDAMRDLCNFTVTGNSETLRYIPRESEGETVTFTIDSNNAIINGISVRLSAPTFKYGGNLYVPVSFFEDYVNNIAVDTDTAKHTISITRETTYAQDVVGQTTGEKYLPLSFKIAKTASIANISEESIDES